MARSCLSARVLFVFFAIAALLPCVVRAVHFQNSSVANATDSQATTWLCDRDTPKRPNDCILRAQRLPSAGPGISVWHLSTLNETCHLVDSRNLTAARQNFGEPWHMLVRNDRASYRLRVNKIFVRDGIPSPFHLSLDWSGQRLKFWQSGWYLDGTPRGPDRVAKPDRDDGHGCECVMPAGLVADGRTADSGGSCHCWFDCGCDGCDVA
jgi:hypothetical protein